MFDFGSQAYRHVGLLLIHPSRRLAPLLGEFFDIAVVNPLLFECLPSRFRELGANVLERSLQDVRFEFVVPGRFDVFGVIRCQDGLMLVALPLFLSQLHFMSGNDEQPIAKATSLRVVLEGWDRGEHANTNAVHDLFDFSGIGFVSSDKARDEWHVDIDEACPSFMVGQIRQAF